MGLTPKAVPDTDCHAVAMNWIDGKRDELISAL